MAVWLTLQACENQTRTLTFMTGAMLVVGLDFAAVMALGAGYGADPEFLADVLAAVEPVMVAALNRAREMGN